MISKPGEKLIVERPKKVGQQKVKKVIINKDQEDESYSSSLTPIYGPICLPPAFPKEKKKVYRDPNPVHNLAAQAGLDRPVPTPTQQPAVYVNTGPFHRKPLLEGVAWTQILQEKKDRADRELLLWERELKFKESDRLRKQNSLLGNKVLLEAVRAEKKLNRAIQFKKLTKEKLVNENLISERLIRKNQLRKIAKSSKKTENASPLVITFDNKTVDKHSPKTSGVKGISDRKVDLILQKKKSIKERLGIKSNQINKSSKKSRVPIALGYHSLLAIEYRPITPPSLSISEPTVFISCETEHPITSEENPELYQLITAPNSNTKEDSNILNNFKDIAFEDTPTP